MVDMLNGSKVFAGNVGRIFLAVGYGKVLTLDMRIIFTYHAVNGGGLIQALSTDVTKPPLVVRWFGPAMRDGVLD